VEILSPPHALLALGIGSIQVGALLMTLAWQNRLRGGVRDGGAAPAGGEVLAQWLFALSLALLTLMIGIMGTEFLHPILMHTSLFYRVAALIFPLVLAAAARASNLRWPATTVAAIYMALRLVGIWLLPLFPATPKLGPIYQHVTHMVPLDFPVLVIVPALAMDLVLRRTTRLNRWATSLLAGLAFLLALLAVQWPFADFLMYGPSRNWFFVSNNYPYAMPSTTHTFRHEFVTLDRNGLAFLRGLAVAALLAVLSTRLGLGAGNWMRRVWR